MAATMQHKMQAHAAFSSSSKKQSLAAPLSGRPLRSAVATAPAVRQQQRPLLQPLQALSTAFSQPLVSPQQQQQQLQQQQPWRQQQRLSQQHRQRRVLLVFAVPAESAPAAGDDEAGLDPNIPAVDQDFDLLGAEVRGRACILQQTGAETVTVRQEVCRGSS